MSEEVCVLPDISSSSLKTELPSITEDLKIESPERASSPEQNCAICLEDFNNKSFTNSCLHVFCFLCLKEWSKIKPECPLCKQRFQTIIYNVRSQDDYDAYEVYENPSQLERAQRVLFNLAFHPHPIQNAINSPNRQRLFDEVELNIQAAINFPHNSVFYLRAMGGRTSGSSSSSTGSSFDQDLTTPPMTYSTSMTNPRNRRDIYRFNRWVRPSALNRFRESSPQFYRLNPAATHRLVPWITRELNVLLDVSVDANLLVQDILELITLYPIQSRQFRDALTPALGDRADHFIHEFYHFAISVHDVLTYDIIAEYDPPGSRPWATSHYSLMSSDTDSDVEVVHVLPSNSSVNRESSGITEGICLDLTNRPGPSGIANQGSETVIDITSSDSEVEIIYVKPPTPLVITIESTDEGEYEPDSNNNPTTTIEPSPSSRRSAVIEEPTRKNKAKVGPREKRFQRQFKATAEIIHNLQEDIKVLQSNDKKMKKKKRHHSRTHQNSDSSSDSDSSSCSSPVNKRSRAGCSPPVNNRSRSSSRDSLSSTEDILGSYFSSDSESEERSNTHRNTKRKKNSCSKGRWSKNRLKKLSIKRETDNSTDEENVSRSSKDQSRIPKSKPRIRSVVKKVEQHYGYSSPPSKSQDSCLETHSRLRPQRNTRYVFPTESD